MGINERIIVAAKRKPNRPKVSIANNVQGPLL